MSKHDAGEKALVDLCQAGDRVAFERLIHRYHRRLYRYVCCFVQEDEAHDVLQLVWFQLYWSLSTLQGSVPLTSWLFQVAKRKCIDLQRKKQRHPVMREADLEQMGAEEDLSLLALLPDPGLLPESYVEQQEGRQRLQAAIARLPTLYGQVVQLRCADLSFQEIGQQLGKSQSTVKTQFHRACAKLRVLLVSMEQEKPRHGEWISRTFDEKHRLVA